MALGRSTSASLPIQPTNSPKRSSCFTCCIDSAIVEICDKGAQAVQYRSVCSAMVKAPVHPETPKQQHNHMSARPVAHSASSQPLQTHRLPPALICATHLQMFAPSLAAHRGPSCRYCNVGALGRCVRVQIRVRLTSLVGCVYGGRDPRVCPGPTC